MSALIEVEVQANYDDDTKVFRELNQHLGFDFDKETGKISFCINIAKEDHYVTLLVDKDELVDAIKRAEAKPLE